MRASIAQIFQSTLLMRGATLAPLTCRRYADHFNPRSSCEERPTSMRRVMWPSSFQSTLLMRGATFFHRLHSCMNNISIHAPHARSDEVERLAEAPYAISIHAPHARSDRLLSMSMHAVTEFQSTLLMRGATAHPDCPADVFFISIHAPHARSDDCARRCVRVDDISIHAPHARSDLPVVSM